MVYVYAVVLTLVNLLCWVGILFGLPGTWLMVLFPVLLKWWAEQNPKGRHLLAGMDDTKTLSNKWKPEEIVSDLKGLAQGNSK